MAHLDASLELGKIGQPIGIQTRKGINVRIIVAYIVQLHKLIFHFFAPFFLLVDLLLFFVLLQSPGCTPAIAPDSLGLNLHTCFFNFIVFYVNFCIFVP